MGENSSISWTTHTFNMWWGCWKIAKECENCYADATAHRYTAQFGELWGRTAGRRFFGESHWREPEKWNRKAERLGERHRVFVGSMMDWAEIHPDPAIRDQMNEARARLWELIKSTPHLDWLLLTKRPSDAAGLLPWATIGAPPHPTPWRNVWIGVTAGTNATMRENAGILRTIPAAVRFISCEPILEHISQEVLDTALALRHPPHDGHVGSFVMDTNLIPSAIHWLIVGDESGHGARPAQGDWIRTVREACARHGVAFHFKQWAGRDVGGIEPANGHREKGRKIHLPILDGKQHAAFPKGAT